MSYKNSDKVYLVLRYQNYDNSDAWTVADMVFTHQDAQLYAKKDEIVVLGPLPVIEPK